MKKFLLFFLFFSFSVNAISKRHMLNEIDLFHHYVALKYAPKEWKKELFDWELDRTVAYAKSQIIHEKDVNERIYRNTIKDFFNSMRDYHVSVYFHATEHAILPFSVIEAQGRYFVSYIDDYKKVPFQVGDEILLWNGKPISEVVEEIQKNHLFSSNEKTDRSLALRLLTYRDSAVIIDVPKEDVVITYSSKNNEIKEEVVNWMYFPEKMRYDFSLSSLSSNSKKRGLFFDRKMIFPLYKRLKLKQEYLAKENPYSMGSEQGFLPPLGKILWKTYFQPFYAYLYETKEKKKIGFLRIASYEEDDQDVFSLRFIIKKFCDEADLLIIDQMNNPGGYYFFLFFIASLLTDQPLALPKESVILDHEEVFFAYEELKFLYQIKNEQQLHMLYGNNICGYPIDFEFCQKMKRYCQFLIEEWNQGKKLTDFSYFLDISHIKPDKKVNFTKPILILINELDFSCADFFPAIMQDNNRAILLGVTTAGAGGGVREYSSPSFFGVSNFSLTASIAQRTNGDFIENVGVTPDIEHEITLDDIRYNFKDLKQKISETVHSMLGS